MDELERAFQETEPDLMPQGSPWKLVTRRIQVPVDTLHPRGEACVLEFQTVTGKTVLFLPPDAAVSVGELIIECGREASTGLWTPP